MKPNCALACCLLLAGVTKFFGEDLKPLDPEKETDRVQWWQLDEKFGPPPKIEKAVKVGCIEKTLVNEHWRQMQKGYETQLPWAPNVTVAIQAAQSEADTLGQLSLAENMVTNKYDLLLISPITTADLQPAIDEAVRAGIPWVDVEDSIIPQATHYVGVSFRENGVRAARWFIQNLPNGGKLALIEGLTGSYAGAQRADGFKTTIAKESPKLQVVASVPGNWDRQVSYDATTNVLERNPDIVGIYASNDTMALGVVEAVKAAGKLKQVAVIGTDGVDDAYRSIQAGEMAGTVDAFPLLTARVAKEVGLRILAGQKLPRVVAAPQATVTKANYDRYKSDPAATLKALIEDEQSQKQ
jgi:ribose transport system substrate-binding protein